MQGPVRLFDSRIRQLLRLHCWPPLLNFVGLDDMTQNVWLSVFRAGYSPGPEDWPLMVTATLNEIRTQATYAKCRKRDFRRSTPLRQADEEGTWDAVMAVRDGTGDRLELGEMINGLAPKLRSVASLRMQGFEVDEIAGRLKRSTRTVERQLQQCRRELCQWTSQR